MMKLIFAVTAAMLLLSCTPAASGDYNDDLETSRAVIRRVFDGGTVEVEFMENRRPKGAGQTETLRLIGVEADPYSTAPGAVCSTWAEAAAQYIGRYKDGGIVYVQTDSITGSRDAAGRLNAYIWFDDSEERLLNEDLIAAGLVRFRSMPMDSWISGRLSEAEKQAKKKHTGRWHDWNEF